MSTARVVARNTSKEATVTSKRKQIPPNTCVLASSNSSDIYLKHKRRFCRIEGCDRIVKSQGLCQRHGAKPKTCKVEGCAKQAQGNFDLMCKAHFKAMKRQTTPIPKVLNTDTPPPAEGVSVYDDILPSSLNFLPSDKKIKTDNGEDELNNLMPLIGHLKHGFDTLKPPAWHRNEERRSRGLFPIDNPAAQLEGWERELVWMEILVLTGVPGASFRHLARAWGRDKGFHMVLAQFICERFGETERKKRHGEKNTGKKKQCKSKKVKTKVLSMNSDGEIKDVGAEVWDPSIYGDIDTNEALAADIFGFTEKEFERVVSKYKSGKSNFGSEISSSDNNDMVAHEQTLNQHHQKDHQHRETYHDININQNIAHTPVSVANFTTNQIQTDGSGLQVSAVNHQPQNTTAIITIPGSAGEYRQQNPIVGETRVPLQQMNQLVTIQQQRQYQQSLVPILPVEAATRPQIYETVHARPHSYQPIQSQSVASARPISMAHQTVAPSTQIVQVQAITQQLTHIPYSHQQLYLASTTPATAQPIKFSQAQINEQQMTHMSYLQQKHEKPQHSVPQQVMANVSYQQTQQNSTPLHINQNQQAVEQSPIQQQYMLQVPCPLQQHHQLQNSRKKAPPQLAPQVPTHQHQQTQLILKSPVDEKQHTNEQYQSAVSNPHHHEHHSN